MTINFRNKIKADRSFKQQATPSTDDEFITTLQYALESDRGRIINSAAIRRLQQKTQVFPLERNAAVRSRLTHSLEVQQVGRFIVQSIFRRLGDKAKIYGLTGLDRSVESLVEMACLMHDIGNPPFGHSGEAAINRWFSQNLHLIAPEKAIQNSETAALLWYELSTELKNFEGNAQGLRIVASLQNMQLTYAQSACIMKYTRPATLPKSDVPSKFSYLMKKPGYFKTEEAYITEQNKSLEIPSFHRHPLSYIMEAADDISYCLADIEDAVEKSILSLEQVADFLKEQYQAQYKNQEVPKIKGLRNTDNSFSDIVDEALKRAGWQESNKVYEFFINLRVGMIHPLVQHAATQFVENIDSIYQGDFNRALLEDNSQYHAIAKTFKAVAQKYVFSDKEVELLEMRGFKIISGLLDAFLPLLKLDQQTFLSVVAGEQYKDLPLESRLVRKLPQKYILNYQKALKKLPSLPHDAEVYESYLRCRLMQDHISSMTDTFAADEYSSLVLCK